MRDTQRRRGAGLRPILAAAIAGLIISACGPAAAQEVRSHASRASADPAAAQDIRVAMDAFSADLYRVLAREQGNVILSPFSVEVALAMTRAGAVGETASQMDRVLHAALARDLSAGFNALDQALAKRPRVRSCPTPVSAVPLHARSANGGSDPTVHEAIVVPRTAKGGRDADEDSTKDRQGDPARCAR